MTDLISRLAQLIVEDNAILFVGAGLQSGSGSGPGEPALSPVQQIAEALAARINYARPDRSLPAVARDFEVLRGRSELVRALREELEKLSARPSPVYELIAAAISPTTKLITSHLDGVIERALERSARPYVLIVRDTDVPFFDETKITLIKMQGDIDQPDSLVITEDDIDAFIDRLPTISDVVRAFFATKTLIFLGFDLNGMQFKRFFRQVTRNLTSFVRQAYAVVPQPLDEVEARYWQSQHVVVIGHDPVAFLEELGRAVRAARQPAPETEAGPEAPPLPARPYKALESFTAADAAIFAGRKEESQRLANRILAHRLTMLYGESGSGKTSLLQAGVAPRLARRQALLASCVPEPGRPLADLLRRSLAESAAEAGLAAPPAGDLAALIRECQRGLNGPVLLVVDQFEQFLLVYNPAERETAARLLAELLADRGLDLRLVLVLREDFLGPLQELETYIPGLFEVRFRLERLGREAARAAIEEPARLFGVTYEQALVQTLLDDLYAAAEGGVAPPQLQIVCDCLYRNAVEEEGARQISLARFHELGGAQGILGDYVERVLATFPPAEQPKARALLGVLVSSSGVKQRLSLADAARGADVAEDRAAEILDELTRRRLVQRYEVAAGGKAYLEYELTHDYLAARIARWLGEDFWAAQRLRELLRHAYPEWRDRGRLPAPDDLRLAAAQIGRVQFSQAESEMLYAAAVAYGQASAPWEASLAAETRSRILLGLARHAEAGIRGRAVAHLGLQRDGGDEAAELLAESALSDPDAGVRETAARAVAGAANGPGVLVLHEPAFERLISAAATPATAERAGRALAVIRDVDPGAEDRLPPALQGPVRRLVWRARLARGRRQILRETAHAAGGGVWGLGLTLGLLFGFSSLDAAGVTRINLITAVQVASIGAPLGGLVGAVSAGAAALVRALMRCLEDRPQRWRSWGLATLAAAALMAVGFLALGTIFAGPQELEVGRLLAAGALLGLAVAGVAGLPLPIPAALHLLFSAIAAVVALLLIDIIGLLFISTFWWLPFSGAFAGAGFYWGLRPLPGAPSQEA